MKNAHWSYLLANLIGPDGPWHEAFRPNFKLKDFQLEAMKGAHERHDKIIARSSEAPKG